MNVLSIDTEIKTNIGEGNYYYKELKMFTHESF